MKSQKSGNTKATSLPLSIYKIVIYKVNVDKQKELAALFNATSIPLFVFIPMKGDPQLFRGAADKATYKKAIDEFLLK